MQETTTAIRKLTVQTSKWLAQVADLKREVDASSPPCIAYGPLSKHKGQRRHCAPPALSVPLLWVLLSASLGGHLGDESSKILRLVGKFRHGPGGATHAVRRLG